MAYLIGLNDIVSIQYVLPDERALVWLLTSLQLYVFIKTTFQRKCLAILVALIWFLPCVHLQMNYKLTIREKCLVTLVALIRFLPCVYLQMNCKITI